MDFSKGSIQKFFLPQDFPLAVIQVRAPQRLITVAQRLEA